MTDDAPLWQQGAAMWLAERVATMQAEKQQAARDARKDALDEAIQAILAMDHTHPEGPQCRGYEIKARAARIVTELRDRMRGDNMTTYLSFTQWQAQALKDTHSTIPDANRRTDFNDVGDFHKKFDLPFVDEYAEHGAPGPRDADSDLIAFRIKFLREELDEFETGVAEGDHAQMFDALIDLVYVALGTAHLMGYPWHHGWDVVQEANMKKQRAAVDGSDSKRGSKWDVVKPPGWEPPNIAEVLRQCGFE